MSDLLVCAEPARLEICPEKSGARVRIPRMESETDYLVLEEQLLSEVSRRKPDAWIIDLSEHTEGITLVLAGMLSELDEAAKHSGCMVKCVGLWGHDGEGTHEGALTAARMDQKNRESWTGIAEEPSHLRW